MLAQRWLVGLTILFLATSMRAAQGSQAAPKPLAEADLQKLVELGIDDDTIVARLEKGGIDFTADEPTLDRLKKAGASDALLAAVKKAGAAARKKPAGTAPGKAVSYQDVLTLLNLGLEEEAILKRLAASPTVFTLGAEQVKELKQAGATQRLLDALTGRRAQTQQTGDVTDIAVLLDCSGSMMEQTQDGQAKMAVAKSVVTDLIQQIPDGLRLTFIVYGHDRQLQCEAVKVVRPLEEIDASSKSELASAISRLQPAGATPIALALRTAGKELAKNDAACGLVLISDGKETCKGDPAAEAERLAQSLNLSFGVNVVGFDVGEDRGALEAIADAGKGSYYNADSASELAQAVASLSKQIEQKAAPAPQQRESRRFAAAGKDARPGAFFHDAPFVEAGEYKGTLAMMEAHYYQIPVSRGQELRAVGVVQKTPYQASNNINYQTFSITLYDQDLAIVGKEAVTVKDNPTTPVTFRATYTAEADGLLYVAIAASDNHEGGAGYGAPVEPYQPKEPKPSSYTLRLRVEGDGGEGGIEPIARLDAEPGAGFDQAAQLDVPGLAAADLKLGEVFFYRVDVQKGEILAVSAAVGKPWYNAGNRVIKAAYTLTIYDDDQVQVAGQKIEVSMNPPDAYSLSVVWPVEVSGSAYISIASENSGEGVYPQDFEPKPGRVCVLVGDANAETPRQAGRPPYFPPSGGD